MHTFFELPYNVELWPIDVAGIISYDVMERWHQSLFDRLHYEPPPHYVAPGLAQLIAADKALWLLVSEDTRWSPTHHNLGCASHT